MRVFRVFFQQVLEPVAAIDVVVPIGIDEVSGVAVRGIVGDDDDRRVGINPR